jgi:hypothetical protein
MRCPHCDSTCTIVTDVKRLGALLRRYRLCRDCGRKFPTVEQVEHARPTRGDGSEPELTVVPDPPAKANPLPPDITEKKEPKPAAGKPQRFWNITPADVAGDVDGLPSETVDALLEWWNSARRSKHSGNATWTRTAWQQSVARVKALPEHMGLLLARAGAEHGWQTLKPSFLSGNGPSLPPVAATGRPMPKDPAMLAAIQSWPPEPA